MASNVAMSTTLEDVEGLLVDLANRFVDEYKGDRDVAVADALFFFIRAYEKYQPEYGDFRKWVYYRVWMNLLEQKRREARRAAGVTIGPLDDNQPDDRPEHFSLPLFLEGLDEDARFAASLVFNTPPELEHLITTRRTGQWSAYNIREGLRFYLRRHLKWSKGQVVQAFEKVRRAL